MTKKKKNGQEIFAPCSHKNCSCKVFKKDPAILSVCDNCGHSAEFHDGVKVKDL